MNSFEEKLNNRWKDYDLGILYIGKNRTEGKKHLEDIGRKGSKSGL